MMVEVGGVEPPSEAASTRRLRVYPAFGLATGTPTGGLIPWQPFGCTWPRRASGAPEGKSCKMMPLRLSRRRPGGMRPVQSGRDGVIVVRNYCFSRFLTRPTRILDAQSGLDTSRRNRITPIERDADMIAKHARRVKHENPERPRRAGDGGAGQAMRRIRPFR